MQYVCNRRDEEARSRANSFVAILLLILLLLALFLIKPIGDRLFVRNHLKQSEGASVTLRRVALEKTVPDESGALYRRVVQTKRDPSVDFTERRSENLFSIGSKGEVAPEGEFEATMRFENLATAPVGFWVEIVPTGKTSADALQDRVSVSVVTSDTGREYLGDGLSVNGKDGGHIRRLELGDSLEFTVSVRVLPLDGKTEEPSPLSFDLLVHAIGYEPYRPEMTVRLSELSFHSVLPDPDGPIVDMFGNRYSYQPVERFPNGGSAELEQGKLTLSGITPGDKVSFTVNAQNSGNLPLRVRVKVTCVSGEKLVSGLDVVLNGELQSGQISYATDYEIVMPGEGMTPLALEIALPVTAGNEYQGLSGELRITIEAVAVSEESGDGEVAL